MGLPVLVICPLFHRHRGDAPAKWTPPRGAEVVNETHQPATGTIQARYVMKGWAKSVDGCKQSTGIKTHKGL